MKLKHKLSFFNIISKLFLVAILWFILPFIVKKVIYKNADKNLLEKKEKFIKNLNYKEIKDFLIANDSTEVYGSFSTLHNEFIDLEVAPNQKKIEKNSFFNDNRKIENELSEYRILQHNFSYNNKNYLLEIGSNINEIDTLTNLLHSIIIVCFMIITFFTFFIDVIYVNYLLKPFYEIVETKIKLINNPEKFSQKQVKTTSTEIKDLDIALLAMMARINELFKKEKEFIGNVSHELLTPISILKNRFENLIQNQSLNDVAVDKISDSLNTLDSMKKVIANLLLISRIDNNQYKTDELIDFKEVVANVIFNFEDRIQEKNIVIAENIKHNTIFHGNKTLIQILIGNLLVNAIKYNNQNGSIHIDDDFIDEKYSLKITNTGFGMHEAQVSQIFNRFTRINFEQEGQGIGLAIVDSIAHLHQIEIKVISEINKRTTFVLLFPKTKKLNKS